MAVQIMTVPIGTIVAYGGNVKDRNILAYLHEQGWEVCDGALLEKVNYPDLYEVIGSFYGGDRSARFRLPDLRGRFVRGVDHGTGRDPDAKDRGPSAEGSNEGDNVGSLQSDAFAKHSHELKKWSRSFSGSNDPEKPLVDEGPLEDKTATAGESEETRPKNLYANFIIKAENK